MFVQKRPAAPSQEFKLDLGFVDVRATFAVKQFPGWAGKKIRWLSLRGARRGRSRLTALCALAHNNEATGEAKSSSASSERLEEIPPPLAELAALLRVISLRYY
ncbi:hypothetical protein C0Q70_01121 [Pomacea canaliculata]|uniref:Uncharacterized protein n=1 Tax=Pomacea canaliculata TaxID=400727 RepID=A0A2T7PYK2_POMCA|nr:hypothetical protein C0Q70_01121 [Pomacea canaliculata]